MIGTTGETVASATGTDTDDGYNMGFSDPTSFDTRFCLRLQDLKIALTR
jgi:hypothetical protein